MRTLHALTEWFRFWNNIYKTARGRCRRPIKLGRKVRVYATVRPYRPWWEQSRGFCHAKAAGRPSRFHLLIWYWLFTLLYFTFVVCTLLWRSLHFSGGVVWIGIFRRGLKTCRSNASNSPFTFTNITRYGLATILCNAVFLRACPPGTSFHPRTVDVSW